MPKNEVNNLKGKNNKIRQGGNSDNVISDVEGDNNTINQDSSNSINWTKIGVIVAVIGTVITIIIYRAALYEWLKTFL